MNLPAIRGKELKKYVLTVAKKKQRQWIVRWFKREVDSGLARWREGI